MSSSISLYHLRLTGQRPLSPSLLQVGHAHHSVQPIAAQPGAQSANHTEPFFWQAASELPWQQAKNFHFFSFKALSSLHLATCIYKIQI